MQFVQARPVAVPQLPQRSAGASGRALIALVLALLTGLTLGQLTLLGGSSFEKSPGRSTEATRTGLEFYDAVETYLVSGQIGALQKLVQSDFIDHIDGQLATSGAEAFLHQLETLRAFDSRGRLTATPVSSSGDLVRFAVSVLPGAESTILGLPFAQPEVAAFSDTLRIAGGRVAERWSNFQAPIATTLLTSMVWDPPPASQMLPAINRMTMLSGSSLTLQLGTAHVIVVESGSLTITGTPRGAGSSLPEFPEESRRLEDAEPLIALPGLAVVAAGDGPYRVVNDGPVVTRALLIRIAGYSHSGDRPETGTSHNDVGVQIETLAAAIVLPNHKGNWTIEIGRATLAPGTIIPAHEVAGSELILVEQGALDADLGACAQRCIQTIESAGAFAMEQTPLRAGQGISASDGATPAYRVASSTPATLLIVTVAPEHR
jgi:hypothetical protein